MVRLSTLIVMMDIAQKVDKLKHDGGVSSIECCMCLKQCCHSSATEKHRRVAVHFFKHLVLYGCICSNLFNSKDSLQKHLKEKSKGKYKCAATTVLARSSYKFFIVDKIGFHDYMDFISSHFGNYFNIKSNQNFPQKMLTQSLKKYKFVSNPKYSVERSFEKFKLPLRKELSFSTPISKNSKNQDSASNLLALDIHTTSLSPIDNHPASNSPKISPSMSTAMIYQKRFLDQNHTFPIYSLRRCYTEEVLSLSSKIPETMKNELKIIRNRIIQDKRSTERQIDTLSILIGDNITD